MRGSAVAPHVPSDRARARRTTGLRFDLKLRDKLLVLIIVPLAVILLLVGGVTWQSVQTRRASDASDRSTAALQSAQMLFETLIDAETGMRGYVLTGDKHFTGSLSRRERFVSAAHRRFRNRVANRSELAQPNGCSRQ